MKKESLRLTVSYAAVQFFFWFAYGTALAYASPYLLACGLSNTAIGLINASACALSVIIQAYMTMTLTAATVIGSLGGGWLIDAAGVQGMLIAAVLCGAAGTGIVWISGK